MSWFFMNKQFEQLCGMPQKWPLQILKDRFNLTIQYSCEIELYAIWTHLRYSFIVVLSAKNHLKPNWRYFLILLKPISTSIRQIFVSVVKIPNDLSATGICFQKLLMWCCLGLVTLKHVKELYTTGSKSNS